MLTNEERSNGIYLIGEIGINHNGDIQIAKKLIDAVFAANWDCVKFQKRNSDICVPEVQKNVEKKTPWGTMSYIDYRKKIEFGKEEYDYIDKYCREKPLRWAASVWDIDSLHFIKQYDVAFIKIPSAKLVDHELVSEAARSSLPLIVSTGMSTLDEIDKSVDILRKNNASFILMHTNSNYPCKMEDVNLKCLNTLRQRYECEIGYSGHEYDLEPTVFATVLGARTIERHITLSHEMWGSDQSASLELMGMDMLRKRVKDIDAILGDGVKRITPEELQVRKKLRGY